MSDLFDNQADQVTPQKKRCYACDRFAARPKPLCSYHADHLEEAMDIITADVAAKYDAWKDAQRTASDATQERFVRVLEAHSEAEHTSDPRARRKAFAAFEARLKTTKAKGDELGKLVTLWDAWRDRESDRVTVVLMSIFSARVEP